MNSSLPQPDLARVTTAIINSIVELLSPPDLDLDGGTIRLLDHDDTCIWFGLFQSDESGNEADAPIAAWTVEVSLEMKGAK